MRIAFATLVLDPFGSLVLELAPGGANLGDTARRVSRVATLDGGVAMMDGGYTVADRTMTLNLAGQSRATMNAVKYLVQNYASIIVMTEDGAFMASPERLSLNGAAASVSLLVSGIAKITG